MRAAPSAVLPRQSDSSPASAATFRLTANCVRCISLNIDYDTGKRLEGRGLPLQCVRFGPPFLTGWSVD